MSSGSSFDLPKQLRIEFANWEKEVIAPSIQLTESFRQKTWEFLDEHTEDNDPGAAGDAFFSHFTGVWVFLMRQGRLREADDLWCEAVKVAREWEQKSGSLVHKGTAYYFWGGTAVLSGNFRMGFALLHSALEEDRRKHAGPGLPDSPAYKFVTLDKISEEQFFKRAVEFAARRVDDALTEYRKTTGSNLIYVDFQDRFLKQDDLREVVFVFSLAVFERLNLELTFEALDFSGGGFLSQLCANTLLDLCQVVEETIRSKNPSGRDFQTQVNFLMEEMGWDRSGDPIGAVNAAQKSDFEACVSSLLTGRNVASRSPVSLAERDLWLTYVLRNSTAHDLSGKQIVGQKFYSLFQAVMNTLFMVTERLY